MEASAAPERTRRPIRPSGVVDEAFSLYAEHARVLLPTALLVVGVFAVVQALLASSGSFALILLGNALSIVASALYSGFVVKFVERLRSGGGPASVGDMFAAVAAVLGTLILNGILYGFAVAIGLVLLIVPGLIILTMWCLAAPSIVIEGRGVTEAFRRSAELTHGQRMPIFLTLLLALVVLIGLGIVLGLIGAVIGTVGIIVMQILASVIAAPVFSLIVAVLFFDLRGADVPVEPAAGPLDPPPAATA
ncbi:hypothetical protein HJD18_15035 [Thermoleophilia bacterium SCSIO 60948]|nr:hypothetical protein HJD18_15035 [Thermoleophilia bacterium SCSIO 60948]